MGLVDSLLHKRVMAMLVPHIIKQQARVVYDHVSSTNLDENGFLLAEGVDCHIEMLRMTACGPLLETHHAASA